jgi:metallo-beta-lactamase class B
MHRIFLVLSLFLCSTAAFAQRDLWEAPFPAHTIAGNLHYIGTADLACFLITTPQGHILINTGLASSFNPMRESARKLGFKLEDVKILLVSQAHFDHTEALAAIQKISGAKMFATEPDAPILNDGGKTDPSFKNGNRFPAIQVDRVLKDGEKIRLGGTELTVILTPGHSKGSVSYSMTVNDKGTQRNVLMANMGSVVLPLVNNAHYPNIVEDFEHTFRVQKALRPDIWLATHGSQYGLDAKYKAGSFVDPEGYRKAVEHYEQLFRKQLGKERGGR